MSKFSYSVLELSFSGKESFGMGPVSYTHLDVYKRQMYNHILWVRENLNKRLSVEGILLTMFEPNTKAWGLTKKVLFENFGDDILHTVIPKSPTITEAEFYGKPTMLFDVKSSGSVAYLQLASELMNKGLLLEH